MREKKENNSEIICCDVIFVFLLLLHDSGLRQNNNLKKQQYALLISLFFSSFDFNVCINIKKICSIEIKRPVLNPLSLCCQWCLGRKRAIHAIETKEQIINGRMINKTFKGKSISEYATSSSSMHIYISFPIVILIHHVTQYLFIFFLP